MGQHRGAADYSVHASERNTAVSVEKNGWSGEEADEVAAGVLARTSLVKRSRGQRGSRRTGLPAARIGVPIGMGRRIDLTAWSHMIAEKLKRARLKVAEGAESAVQWGPSARECCERARDCHAGPACRRHLQELGCAEVLAKWAEMKVCSPGVVLSFSI
jgi:hypothetical protein